MWCDVVSAISNLVMAAFAVIAGIYAKGQYDEAKHQRELALRQEQEERRKEAKQDELALQQQQQHERELIETRNRALFLERQREIAHVEAFAVKNGRNYAVELSVPTEASIYEVRVWAQWPDTEFAYGHGIGNRDACRNGNPHVAPSKSRPWRMIRPGNWQVGTTRTRYPWTQPEPVLQTHRRGNPSSRIGGMRSSNLNSPTATATSGVVATAGTRKASTCSPSS